MLRRKFKTNQWLLVPVVILLTFSGSVLFRKSVKYERTTPKSAEELFSLAPSRHVTKSLAELGKMDEVNKHVLFLNKMPHCGAEVLVFLLQKLQGLNSFRHVRLAEFTGPILTKIEQEQFVDHFFQVMRNQAVPLSLDGQINFVNFTKFDRQSPTFVSMIRDPTDKVLSRSFYSNRNDAEVRKCLAEKRRKCRFVEDLLVVPYFCGHDPRCLTDNRWALSTAMSNVEKYYPVVGVLEELNSTLEVLEHRIPYFFKGVQDLYKKHMIDKFLSRNKLSTKLKLNHLKSILGGEYEFYEWVKRRLFQQLQIISGNSH